MHTGRFWYCLSVFNEKIFFGSTENPPFWFFIFRKKFYWATPGSISQKRGFQNFNFCTFLESSKAVLSGYKKMSMEIFCQIEKMAAQVHLFADLRFPLVSRPPNFRGRGQLKVANPLFGFWFLSCFRICMVISTLKQYLKSYQAQKVQVKTCDFGRFWGFRTILPPKTPTGWERSVYNLHILVHSWCTSYILTEYIKRNFLRELYLKQNQAKIWVITAVNYDIQDLRFWWSKVGFWCPSILILKRTGDIISWFSHSQQKSCSGRTNCQAFLNSPSIWN